MSQSKVLKKYLENEHKYKAYIAHNVHKFNSFTNIEDLCMHAASSVLCAIAEGKFDKIKTWSGASKYISGIYKNTIRNFCEFNSRTSRTKKKNIDQFINKARVEDNTLKDIFNEVEEVLKKMHKSTYIFWVVARDNIPGIITERFARARERGALRTQLTFKQSSLSKIGKMLGISRERTRQHKEIIKSVYNRVISDRAILIPEEN